MTIKNDKDDRVLEYTSQLAGMNNRIEELEKSETVMLHNLQKSINEHNRLLSLSQTGGMSSMSAIDKPTKRKTEIM